MSNDTVSQDVLIITGDQASLLDLHRALHGDPHVKAEFAPPPVSHANDYIKGMEYRLDSALKLMNLAREASARDLEAKRAAEAKLVRIPDLEPSLESRAGNWVSKRLGAEHADERERAARVFEEACEFSQAAGVPAALALRIQNYVYTREPGRARSEAASVAVTLMAWLWFSGERSLQHLTLKELDRIEALPQEKIDASLKRKIAAGIVTVQPKVEPDKPEESTEPSRESMKAIEIRLLKAFRQMPDVSPEQAAIILRSMWRAE